MHYLVLFSSSCSHPLILTSFTLVYCFPPPSPVRGQHSQSRACLARPWLWAGPRPTESRCKDHPLNFSNVLYDSLSGVETGSSPPDHLFSRQNASRGLAVLYAVPIPLLSGLSSTAGSKAERSPALAMSWIVTPGRPL